MYFSLLLFFQTLLFVILTYVFFPNVLPCQFVRFLLTSTIGILVGISWERVDVFMILSLLMQK